MFTSFTFIFILSSVIGLIGYINRDHKVLLFLIPLIKGFLSIHLASLINDTGLSLLLAALGVLTGYFIVNKYVLKIKIKPEFLFLGILIRFSVFMAVLSLLFFLIIYNIIKSRHISILLSSVFLLFSLYFLKKPDSSIILGFIILITLFLEFISYIKDKREVNTPFVKKSFYIKVFSVLSIISICILLFFNRYVYKGFGMQEDIIRNGPREFRYIAITFDDGPHPGYTNDILDILKVKGVKASFFLLGKNAEKYPEIVKRIAGEGHVIGNHTYSHRSLIPLSQSNTNYEILEGEKVIEEITGEKPTLFRPPRGVYSDYAMKVLKDNRYTVVLWDVTSQDWRELRYNNIVSNVLNNVRNGSIILFHDSGDIFRSSGGNRINTVKALPLIIKQLHAHGYEFITIDEMLVLKGLAEKEETIVDLFDGEEIISDNEKIVY